MHKMKEDVVHKLFDAFDIVKNNDGVNTFVERKNEAL